MPKIATGKNRYCILLEHFIHDYIPKNWVVCISNVAFVPTIEVDLMEAIEKFQDEHGLRPKDGTIHDYVKQMGSFVRVETGKGYKKIAWYDVEAIEEYQKQNGKMADIKD